MSSVRPYLLGSGNSGKAIAKSLSLLSVMHPEWDVAPIEKLGRDPLWDTIHGDPRNALLFVANPHGLHARTILEAEKAGFHHIVCEKPACVSLNEARELRLVKADVGVFHGYRQMWGPQAMRDMILDGELGDLIALEGRYWQSSAAQRALDLNLRKPGWKNDPILSGDHDTLLDLASHWVDISFFLVGAPATGGAVWKSFANAEASHRDTHVHLTLEFPKDVRALASVSKTVHGTGNDLEVVVLGTKAAVTWRFGAADKLLVGKGGTLMVVPRPTNDPRGASFPPFHGMGWLEGYLAIVSAMVRRMRGEQETDLPTLGEHLDVMECLLGLR